MAFDLGLEGITHVYSAHQLTTQRRQHAYIIQIEIKSVKN